MLHCLTGCLGIVLETLTCLPSTFCPLIAIHMMNLSSFLPSFLLSSPPSDSAPCASFVQQCFPRPCHTGFSIARTSRCHLELKVAMSFPRDALSSSQICGHWHAAHSSTTSSPLPNVDTLTGLQRLQSSHFMATLSNAMVKFVSRMRCFCSACTITVHRRFVMNACLSFFFFGELLHGTHHSGEALMHLRIVLTRRDRRRRTDNRPVDAKGSILSFGDEAEA